MTQAFDWDGVSLVVFDLDGTLYRQAPLRRRMASEMAKDALASRSLTTIRVVAAYRRLREALGEAETQDFEPVLLSRCAASTGLAADAVQRIVHEWLERRPLRVPRQIPLPPCGGRVRRNAARWPDRGRVVRLPGRRQAGRPPA